MIQASDLCRHSLEPAQLAGLLLADEITENARVGLGFVHRAACLDPPIRVSRPGGPTLPTIFRLARRASTFSLVLMMASTAAAAGPPSDTLLPRSTKGYVSVARPKEFDDRWNKTQIGQMFNDDVMKAFVDDFHKQMRDDFGSIEKRLGITYDDLKGVTGGEMSLSLIERKGQDAALAVTI